MRWLGMEKASFGEVNRVFPLRTYLFCQLPPLVFLAGLLYLISRFMGRDVFEFVLVQAIIFYPLHVVVGYWITGLRFLRRDRRLPTQS